MDHELRVLVRLDIDATSAVLEVNGCLTEKSCQALLPVIRRAGSLIPGLDVIVDLSHARYIEASALDILHQLNPAPGAVIPRAAIDGRQTFVHITAPAVLPICPAQHALRPAAAAEAAA